MEDREQLKGTLPGRRGPRAAGKPRSPLPPPQRTGERGLCSIITPWRCRWCAGLGEHPRGRLPAFAAGGAGRVRMGAAGPQRRRWGWPHCLQCSPGEGSRRWGARPAAGPRHEEPLAPPRRALPAPSSLGLRLPAVKGPEPCRAVASWALSACPAALGAGGKEVVILWQAEAWCWRERSLPCC